MREPVGEGHPLAVIACSRDRANLAHVREEAGRHDGTASFLSKGDNRWVINQVQTQKGAQMIEVTRETCCGGVDVGTSTDK